MEALTRVPSWDQVGPIQIKTFLCFAFFAFRKAASPLLSLALQLPGRAWLSLA